MFNRSIARVLIVTIILTSFLISGGTQIFAAGTIINDTANKIVTATCSNMSMQFNYNNKMIVSSIKMGTVETIEANETDGSCSDVTIVNSPVNISASYTYSKDDINSLNNGVISYTDSPRDRWTCYNSGNTSDSLTFNFGSSQTVSSVKLYLYSDGGGVKAPASYKIQYWNGSNWVDCASQSKSPATPTGNAVNIDTFTPVSTQKIQIVFNHQSGSYSGATELEIFNGSTNLSTNSVYNKGTFSLLTSPTVSVNGNIATFSNITYTAGNCTVSEIWTVTANDGNISLQVSKTYGSAATLTDQRTIAFAFKEKAFDVVQRTEDGGSFILLDANRNRNRFLDLNLEGYGFNSSNMDFLDKSNNLLLSITMSTSRNKAAVISRGSNATNALKIGYEMNSAVFGHVQYDGVQGTVGYHHTYNVSSPIFKPVFVTSGQQDTATFTFSSQINLNQYYNIGTIPSASGINTSQLAQYLQDFGRSSVIDYNEGMGDCGIESPIGMGAYEAWWYAANASALQGAGNQKYTDTLKNLFTFYINNGGQEGSGHLQGRTVGWGRGGWEMDTLYDADPQYVLGIVDTYNLNADTTWLNSVKTSAEAALDYMLTRDSNGNGLYENDLTSTLLSQSHREWNDATFCTFEDSYINALMFGALTKWAEIEQNVLENSAKATNYLNKAAALKTQYNKDTASGGFWSGAHSSYVFWRDQDGSIHADSKQLLPNMCAIIFGLADSNRANLIMADIEPFMVSNNLKMYPMNLYDMGPNQGESINYPFPNYLNGGILYQNAYEVMGAYAAIGEGTIPLKYLKNAISQYNTDGMFNGNFYTWTNTKYGYEKWMSSGVRPAVGFYNFIMGIKPKFNKITIDPCIDSSLNGVSVNYTLRGHIFTITLNSQTVRNINTDGTIPVESVWSNLSANTNYTVTDNGANTVINSGTNGQVVYSFSSSGNHVLTLSGGTPANLALNTSGTGYPSPSASYTFNQDSVWKGNNGVISYNDSPRDRWTCYSSGNTSDWYSVDFGTAKDVNDIKLYIYNDNGGVKTPASYNVQYWDGTTWVDCANQVKSPVSPTGNAVNEVSFTTINTQKVRVVFTHQSGSYSGVTEFEAYKNAAPPPPLNLALNTSGTGYPSPSASYTFNQDSLWNGINGVISYNNSPRDRWTCYSSGNATDWYAIDFGTAKTVSSAKLYIYDDGGGVKSPASYSIQYWNGSAWVDCASQVKTPVTPTGGTVNSVTFTSVSTQKVRIVFTHQSASYSGLTEFELY